MISWAHEHLTPSWDSMLDPCKNLFDIFCRRASRPFIDRVAGAPQVAFPVLEARVGLGQVRGCLFTNPFWLCMGVYNF